MVLLDEVLDDTLVRGGERLCLEVGSCAASGKTSVVHGSLKRIALPTKNVVAMLAKSSAARRFLLVV